MYDIIIIGAGPAGMTAAIYAKQARKKVLILEKETYGGQILKANLVKNYPGIEEISGYEFAEKLYNQMQKLDPEIKYEEVIQIKNLDSNKLVITKKNKYSCRSIIIATGAANRKLGINNEDNLIGKGVSYCATCDGMFFKDKIVAITGGGNNAIDDALYLSDICKKIYYIYRQNDFKFDSESINILKSKNNIEFLFNSTITNLNGTNKLESIDVINAEDNNTKNIVADCLFIAIGHIPVSSICNNLIETNKLGYIISSDDCTTNIDGIYVAGDVRKKDFRQLTTACSDGTIATLNACKYIKENFN